MYTKTFFTFSPEWDFQITVEEYEQVHTGESNAPVKKLAQSAIFQVQRSKLTACEHFQTMLRGPWRESRPESITLEGNDINAMNILFRSLHGTLDEITLDSISIKTIWFLVMVCDKYDVGLKTGFLKAWFVKWYDAEHKKQKHLNNCEFERTILFPCYYFDYATGFQEATIGLVYNSEGHISERNPTREVNLHLPPRIMQQVNAARGRLRNILHNGLFDHIASVVSDARCSCKEATVFDYFRELKRLEVWPLENTMKHASINDIITRLRGFDAEKMRPPKDNERPGYCKHCSRNWKGIVKQVGNKVADYFDGMCLDCMSVTKCLREGRNPDHEYWMHGKNRQYDADCRIKHGEPTWWFSFMGQREKQGLLAF
ncbi:hypothetical protein BDW59DRAFT_182118 [Aspergillus cavernicola]|uniref:BTB domain-containing protein n=1 Tax=Aspergillus cavernicola TaxID=176166 RepID=A0ABR4IUL5_9EURO